MINMLTCILCEKEYSYLRSLCPKCRRIKHHISLNGDRVYEVLDSVLSRTQDKQENKIKQEIKQEIENKALNLKK